MKRGVYLAATLDEGRRPAKEIRGQFDAQMQGHVLAKFPVIRGLDPWARMAVARSGPEKIVPNGSSRLFVGITHHGNGISERDDVIGKEARQESARRDLLERS